MNWLPEDGGLILCVVVFLVVLFNVGLIYSFMNPAARRYLSEIRAHVRLRQSWNREAESLQELREAVEDLGMQEPAGDE